MSRAPAGLKIRGRRLWRELDEAYTFDSGERVILLEACRTADLVDRLAEQLGGGDLTTEGSRGQQVLNPLAAELRQQRELLGRLLARLALPGPDEGQTAATVLGRRGNDARWHRPKRGS